MSIQLLFLQFLFFFLFFYDLEYLFVVEKNIYSNDHLIKSYFIKEN